MKSEETLCTVKSRSWPWRYTFTLTTNAVVQEWTKPADTAKGSKRYPLAELSTRVRRQSEFAHGGEPVFRKALVFLASSACVFFSEFNHQMPLLAPLLAIVGLWALITLAFRLRDYHWTIFDKTDGGQAFTIPHYNAQRSELEKFESQFVEAVLAQRRGNAIANQASEATSEPALSAASSSPQG